MSRLLDRVRRELASATGRDRVVLARLVRYLRRTEPVVEHRRARAAAPVVVAPEAPPVTQEPPVRLDALDVRYSAALRPSRSRL